MDSAAAEIARRLGREAEAVCGYYLSNGRRQGRYWIVGDIENTPGPSLYVRLTGPSYGPGAAGKWTDAATGEHGDLLDLIAANRNLARLRDALDEARRFLSLPRREPPARQSAPTGSLEAARRLWAMGKPVTGTLAERYLAGRGIVGIGDVSALRFHPRCYYRGEDGSSTTPDAWPALLAKITDLSGEITGLHRTWLDPIAADKAPVDRPRKAMGHLLGNGVRVGRTRDVLVAGKGLETMLSIRLALPTLPVVAALSANHLQALILQGDLQRLYIAEDADDAGRAAAAALAG
ncbi:MAG: toprim domain-containing protein [Rhodospirillales bacterium]